MARFLVVLGLVTLSIGCGQNTAQPGKDSAAPAYVAPTSASNETADEDQRDAKQDPVADADLDVASESSPAGPNNRSAAADEEMADDDLQPDDVAGDSGANVSDPDSSRETVRDEPAHDDDADRTDTGVSQKHSAGKLLRGLANSVSRAVAKSYSKRTILPPPVEDDPFPKGEPEDADPDLNR